MKIPHHHRIRSKDGQSLPFEAPLSALRGLGHEAPVVGPDAWRNRRIERRGVA